jgi:hypothetical protein
LFYICIRKKEKKKRKKKKFVTEVSAGFIVECAIEKMQNICVKIVGNQDVELQKLKKAKK